MRIRSNGRDGVEDQTGYGCRIRFVAKFVIAKKSERLAVLGSQAAEAATGLEAFAREARENEEALVSVQKDMSEHAAKFRG